MRARPPTNGGAGPAWLVWVTRASLGLGLVALAATIWVVGPHPLATHLAQIGPWFAVLLAIDLAGAVCDAGVVYYMTRGSHAPSFRKTLVAQLAGRAVNSVTPGANVGEALKISLLARECSTQRVVAAVLFQSLGTFVLGMIVVAAGTFATAFLFALPTAAELALITCGFVTGAIALGTLVLVRRGMLAALARALRKLHLISQARHERWRDQLDAIDRRLRGDAANEHRPRAWLLVALSQILSRVLIWATLAAMGYALAPAQLVVVLSAGLLLTWLSAIVPLGVGVSEGGNGVLFAAIGAPTSLGVALAFARSVNQFIFAALGFTVLAIDRMANDTDVVAPGRLP
jgi:uncharacterized protein (TIRG00374 family)